MIRLIITGVELIETGKQLRIVPRLICCHEAHSF